MRNTLIQILIILYAVLFFGCHEDNVSLISDKLEQAAELKSRGDSQKAMEKLLEARSLIDDKTPLGTKIDVNTQLGAIYYDNHKIADAGRYFRNAVEEARAVDSIKSRPWLLWNLVLTINDTDTLRSVLSRCRDYSDFSANRYLAVLSRINLAKICVMKGDMPKAKAILDSLSSDEFDDYNLNVELTMQRAATSVAENDFTAGISLLRSLDDGQLSLDGKVDKYNLLYRSAREIGDYRSSLAYRDSLALFRDSIQSIISNEKINRVESEYNAKSVRDKKERRLILWIGSLIAVLLITIVLLINRSRKLNARQVSLVEQISRLNLELTSLRDDSDTDSEDKTAAVISKLRLSKELFVSLPQYRYVTQANLEPNPEDISKDRQKEILDSVIAHFSDVSNNLKKIYPGLSSEDLLMMLTVYSGLNNDVISVLLKSSGDALRQRKSRMKKKVPTEVFEVIFGK